MQNGPVNSTGGTGFSLLANGATANGWLGQATNGAGTARTLHVYVVCAA